MLASLSPATSMPQIGMSDKLEHALTYGVLTLWFCGAYTKASGTSVGVGLFIFGALIEALQAFTATRSAEVADLFANTAGILGALALATGGLANWCAMVEALVGADR